MAETKNDVKARRYYTIGEVAKLLDLEPHVLRFWEKEFRKQIRPLRLAGRRLYPPEQVEIFRRIKTLLYEEGYTIAGAKKKLAAKKDEPGLREVLLEIRKDLLAIYKLLDNNS
ncbi:MerR family transcriptional regulator [Thermodesulfatator atlanticus]|uniref:MerR family transcriptional regulator n=1 Tax=Thermodesulfatator atlanticus TaxID=501497 RepID=UPI0003FFC092|nr:MerR family transcriptional regulator [Thermodesulfatator atlanticus]